MTFLFSKKPEGNVNILINALLCDLQFELKEKIKSWILNYGNQPGVHICPLSHITFIHTYKYWLHRINSKCLTIGVACKWLPCGRQWLMTLANLRMYVHASACVLLGERDINCILCGGVKSIPEERKRVTAACTFTVCTVHDCNSYMIH